MDKFPNAREIGAAPVGTVLRSDSGHIYLKYCDFFWMAVFLNDVSVVTPRFQDQIDSLSVSLLLASTGLEHLE